MLVLFQIYLEANILNIEEVNMDKIIPYKGNPRKNEHAIDKVAKSIKEFGFKVPIILTKDNIIVAGHTRYEAARRLNMKKVPCIFASDLTSMQVKAFRLIDNKTQEFSKWDFDLLSEELQQLTDFEIDMSEFGFSMDDLSDKLGEQIKDDFEPEIPCEPKSKNGDIYELGRHRLICGDSTDIGTIKKLMDGKMADLLLTDHPYNVNYTGQNGGKIRNDNMNIYDFEKFIFNAFWCADHFMRPGCVFYVWHSDTFGDIFRSICKKINWNLSTCLIWNKNQFVLGHNDYHFKHEPCLYGWKLGAKHNWFGGRNQCSVLNFDKPKNNDVHPTMKPVDLFEYIIKNSSKQSDIILDLFGGSGTTLIAAESTKRVCYMAELDPIYTDVIIDRWEKATGERAKLLMSDTFKTPKKGG